MARWLIAIVLLLSAGEVLVARHAVHAPVEHAVHAPVEHVVLLASGVQRLALDEQSGRVFITGPSLATRAPFRAVVSVLDSATGALVRTVHTSLPALGSWCCALPILIDAPAGRVYVRSSQGQQLYVLDARTGDVRKVQTMSPIVDLWPVDSGRRVLAVVNAESWGRSPSVAGVRVLDGRSGALLSSIPCPGVSPDDVVWRPAMLYAPLSHLFLPLAGATRGASLCILDGGHGISLPPVPIRARSGAASIEAMTIDEGTARVFVASHADASPGSLPESGLVTVLDARTGRVVATTSVGPFPSQLMAAAGRIYVLDANAAYGTVYGPAAVSILDARTGRLLHTVPLGRSVYTESVDAQRCELDILYQDGSTDRIDLRTGRLLGRARPHTTTTITLGVDPVTHRAYTVQADPLHAAYPPPGNRVQVRDTRSGRLLHTIALPGYLGPMDFNPQGFDPQGYVSPMVIDPQRHRGYIGVNSCHQSKNPAQGCVVVVDTRK